MTELSYSTFSGGIIAYILHDKTACKGKSVPKQRASVFRFQNRSAEAFNIYSRAVPEGAVDCAGCSLIITIDISPIRFLLRMTKGENTLFPGMILRHGYTC